MRCNGRMCKSSKQPKRRPGRWLLVLVAVLLLAAGGLLLQRRLTHNFAVVIPDRVYRSAQMSERDFRRLIDRYQIKTLIQLNQTDYDDLNGADLIVEPRAGYTLCRLRWSSKSATAASTTGSSSTAAEPTRARSGDGGTPPIT